MGNYKLNVGFCKDSRNMNVGLGFVIRDCNGFVAAAMTQQMAWHDDKVQIHAMMVLKALKFSYDVGLRRLEVDLVCKDLFSMLNSDDICLAPIGNLVGDISFFCQRFPFCSFAFVKCICNKATQALCAEALSSNFPQVWLENCPVSIVFHVQFD